MYGVLYVDVFLSRSESVVLITEHGLCNTYTVVD